MTEYDLFEIEKLFLRIDENTIGDVDFVLQLEIIDLGSWLIKFRKSGIIFNQCEVVYVEGIGVDAFLSFKGHSHFWQVMNGGHEFSDELNKHAIRHSGDPAVIELFRASCVKPYDPSAQQMHANISALAPIRTGRILSSDGLQPLKAGFLLKKRDILRGWLNRYFVVYPGKMEYYVDQHDIHSRATISLVGAEVQSAKRQTVKGVAEHWGITVKTKNPDKTFRLASELTGMEGMVEANTWEQVFTVATKPAGPDPSLAPQTMPSPGGAAGGGGGSKQGTPRATLRRTLLPGRAGGGLAVRDTKGGAAGGGAAGGGSGKSSDEDDVSKGGTSMGGRRSKTGSAVMYAGIIVALTLLTYYVWRYSAVKNKALYVTTSIVAVIALIGIFVNQFILPSKGGGSSSSDVGGASGAGANDSTSSSSSHPHAAAIAIIAEETSKKNN